MTFTLFPAVDVAGGQSVRLVRGEAGTETKHGSPLDVALAWQANRAEWIHLVDLDAAFGRGSNAELLRGVIERLDHVTVELSGGIRDDASLKRALSTGCERVILATDALNDLAWCAQVIAEHGDLIAVALDVRIIEESDGSVHHRLAARGGSGDNGDLWETLAFLDRTECARYVVTDVSRDGTLDGPNVDLYRAVTRATNAAVIASGGISSIADLEALARLSLPNPITRTLKGRSSARPSTPVASPSPRHSTAMRHLHRRHSTNHDRTVREGSRRLWISANRIPVWVVVVCSEPQHGGSQTPRNPK